MGLYEKIKSIFLPRKENKKAEEANNNQGNDNFVEDIKLSTGESVNDFWENHNQYYNINPNQFLNKNISVEDDKYDLSMYTADDLKIIIEECIRVAKDGKHEKALFACDLVKRLSPLVIINSNFTLSDDSVEWLIKNRIIMNKPLYSSEKVSRDMKFKLDELSHSEEFHVKGRIIEHALNYYNLKGVDLNASINIIYDTFMYNNVPNFMKIFELHKYLMNAKSIELNDADWIKKYNELFLIALENKDRSIYKMTSILEKGNEILHNQNNYIEFSSIHELDFNKLSDTQKVLFMQYVDTVCTLHNLACVNNGDLDNIVMNVITRKDRNNPYKVFKQKQAVMRDIVAKYESSIEQFNPDTVIDKVFCDFSNIKNLGDLKKLMAEYEKSQESIDKSQGELYYSSISTNGWHEVLKNGNVAEIFNLLQNSEEASSQYDKDVKDMSIKLLRLEDITSAFKKADVNLLFVYRKEELEKRLKKSGDSREITSGKSDGKNYIEINSGLGNLMVDHIIARDWNYLYERELAIANIYIPVYNEKNELIFTREKFDIIRKKEMQGLSYYGTGKYNLDSRCTKIDPLIEFYRELCAKDGDQECESIIEGIRDIIEGKENEEDIRKRAIVYDYIQKIINDTGKTSVNGMNDSLENRFVEIIESGSTARGTNKPGDSDFDYTIKTDNINKLREAFAKAFYTDEEAQKIIDEEDDAIHAKKVKIGNEEYDIDITLVPRTLQIGLSADMGIEDRLHSIKEQYPEEYNYVIANVVLAKVILKKLGIYKKFMSEGATKHGGLGGIGVENWILQEGGSFIGAMEEFLEKAKDESGKVRTVKEMQQDYPVMDYGMNHISRTKVRNGFDNKKDYMPRQKASYVVNITGEGLENFVEEFEKILNDYEKRTQKEKGLREKVIEIGAAITKGFNENVIEKIIKKREKNKEVKQEESKEDDNRENSVIVKSIMDLDGIEHWRPSAIDSYPELLKMFAKYGFAVSLILEERLKSTKINENTNNKGDDKDERT